MKGKLAPVTQSIGAGGSFPFCAYGITANTLKGEADVPLVQTV